MAVQNLMSFMFFKATTQSPPICVSEPIGGQHCKPLEFGFKIRACRVAENEVVSK